MNREWVRNGCCLETAIEYDETKARFVKQEAVAIGSSKSICYVNQQHIATATSSELL